MINRPTELEFMKLAKIKSDKNRPLEDRIIYMHFFLDGHSWYVSEYDPQTRRFFGFIVRNNEFNNARCDYFSVDALDGLKKKPSGSDQKYRLAAQTGH